MSYVERGSYWDLESEGSETMFYKTLPKNQPEPGVAKLKELISTQDLALLDLHERERQLATREAAAIRLEEHGRQQELAAREATLLGREAALAIKERELNLGEREQAVREAEVKLHEQDSKLNADKCKLTELENEFYKKSQEQCTLINDREREVFMKEENLRRREKDLDAFSNNLREQKQDIDNLLQTLKQREDSLQTKLSELEILRENLNSQEKDVKEKEAKLIEKEKQAKLEQETLREEFELTKQTLEGNTLQLKALEKSVILQEKDLENKRTEIQQELHKQDAILKGTANIISEKEIQFQKLERETLDRIAAQENELKLWEQELQQQDLKIQSYKVSLEQHNAEILDKEKAIAEQREYLSQWQNQLQTRAKSLNEQAEAQEEHLRVILEKEKLFDELKFTLEQKEQQYKMLVQCKEHDFEVREQNLQKIICDLLHHESKEERMQCPNLNAFCKMSPLINDTDFNKPPTKLSQDNFVHNPEQRQRKTSDQEESQMKHTHEKIRFQEYTKDVANPSDKYSNPSGNITIKPHLESQQVRHPECCLQKRSNTAQDIKHNLWTTSNKDQDTPMHNPTTNSFTMEKTYLQQDHTPSKSYLVKPSKIEDFTLTRKQFQLLEQIKSNRYIGQLTLTSKNNSIILSNKKKESNTSCEKESQMISSCTDQTECAIKFQFQESKKHHQRDCSFEVPCKLESSHTEVIPCKENNENNQYNSLCTQTFKSGSLENLSEEIHLQLNQQNTLQGAARCHRMELVRSLIEHHGADVDGRDSEGRTALHWAAQLGHLALVKYLGGDMGASVDAQNDIGQTSLHLAALEGRLEVVQYLVNDLGADIESRDFYGETALHLAAGAGWLEVVKYLSSVKGCRFSKIEVTNCVPMINIQECP